MLKFLLSGFFLVFAYGIYAFHIVGGEIEFITVEPGHYRINLIQYFDKAQNDNPGPDPTVTIYIFSNKDDRFISSHTIPFLSESVVNYTNIKCAIEELETSRMLYSQDVLLDPEVYSDEEGYYLVWERCCRNVDIKNIVNPLGAGMKYVVEIPPLWKNGQPYINSSPELLRPLSDYACINQLYYTSFTGTDRDGDSLVYRLATPLNSSAVDPVPTPKPKPHILVKWADGYSKKNIIPGESPLRISGRGLLTVNPESTGLYVFSVIVEEWRAKEKIGEVQRDFQMLVVDGCNPPAPPVVGVKIPGDADFDPEVDVLTYTLEEDKCFDFFVTKLTPGETISLRYEGVNFTEEIDSLFSVTSSYIDPGMDTLWVEVCVPACPPVRDGPFIIDLIAGDDACPLPQLDTARLMIQVEPPPNTFPSLNPLQPGYALNEGEALSLGVLALDADDDAMDLNLVVLGLEKPQDYGFFFEIETNEAGTLEGGFIWDTDCQLYDFSEQQHFQVAIAVEDHDICDLENPDMTWINFEVALPPNTDPEVSIDEPDSIKVHDGDRIELDVSAFDADQDILNLFLSTQEFSAESIGAAFENVSGTEYVESTFTWTVDCDQLGLSGSRLFEFDFIAGDEEKCNVKNYDTLTYKVYVELVENNKPDLISAADTVIEVNQPFTLDISGFDQDEADTLTLEFFEAARRPSSPSLTFERAIGVGSVSSVLEWTPECSLLDFGETSAFFDLTFLVFDDSCPFPEYDTMTITFEIKETREQFNRFTPPNVFTPNGDNKNETWSLTNLARPEYNLPRDNCDDSFAYISIHDRSGKVVYKTENREFVWDGRDVASGTYYYHIQYTNTEYKGFLQVLK